MRRIPIQIDDELYEILRKRAFEEKRSIASIVRQCLEELHGNAEPRQIEEFLFVGSGRSEQGSLAPVSVNHDQALAASVVKRRR